jgi:hypothetical protein
MLLVVEVLLDCSASLKRVPSLCVPHRDFKHLADSHFETGVVLALFAYLGPTNFSTLYAANCHRQLFPNDVKRLQLNP